MTGGLGFIGERIAADLASEGLKVKVATSRKNARLPPELAACELVTIDLSCMKNLVSICEGVSTIIHLAGTNAISSANDPENALMVNGLGTLNLLNAAKTCSIKQFIYFSTIHIYGSPLSGEINEKKLPQPLSSYAITNRLAEDYTLAFGKSDNLDVTVLWLSNVVGLPLSFNSDGWKLVANDFCKQAIVSRSIIINSSGEQQRNFLSMPSLIEIVSRFIESGPEVKWGKIFDVGGDTVTIVGLAKLISERCIKLFGYTIKIKTGSMSEDPASFNFEAKEIKQLGFREYLLINEIDKVLVYCNSNFKHTALHK
jgi:UDP-glucose 4-epimerase